MTEKTRKILTDMMHQFVANHNDERADALDEVLTINPPERLQSQWRRTGIYVCTCDNCKYRIGANEIKNYCPNCGAWMEGER